MSKNKSNYKCACQQRSSLVGSKDFCETNPLSVFSNLNIINHGLHVRSALIKLNYVDN